MAKRVGGLPFRFAITTLTFSLTLSTPTPPTLLSLPTSKPFSTSPSLAADLLSFLAVPSSVPSARRAQIRPWLRFLVPFSPSEMREGEGIGNENENESVWWPPEAVLEIARIAVDSGGDPAAVQRELDPTPLPVPDVEGLKKDKCQLTRTPYGRRFVSKELNSYLALLFEMIASRGPLVGLNVTLDRYDLFHGHMFLATDTGRLGILFHAKEYPAYDEEVFPLNLGYCQKGSNVPYDDLMNLRNILWLAPLPSKTTKSWLAPGILVVLDAHPNGIIYKELVPEYLDYVRTIYEGDFGELVADVNFLNVANAASGDRIFIC